MVINFPFGVLEIKRKDPRPWMAADTDFQRELRVVNHRRITSIKRLYNIYSFARYAPKGIAADVGVYRGASTFLISRFHETHAFDTFEGMPETSEHDWHQKGDLADVGDVITWLESNSVHVHKGKFPDTAIDAQFSFVHVDVDIYSSTKDCLEYFVPHLVKGGVLLCDDYGAETCPGAKKAWDEYFTERTLILPTGQAVYIKP